MRHTGQNGYRAVAVASLALALASCTGSDLGSPTSPTMTNVSATGIWGGTDSATGLSVIGYIDSTGQAVFIRGDGVQFVGLTQVSGETLVAAVVGCTDFGSSFSDGSTSGLGTLNGTVVTGSTLTLSLSFTTKGGTAQNGSWSLAFNTLSNSGASLGILSANYTDTATGSVVTIAADGILTGQNPANGCVLNGTVSVSNGTYDVYEVAVTYENCTGSYAALNGIELTGLAALNTGTAPAQLTIGLSGSAAVGKYAIVLNLTAS
jgi:hypothetical protein